MSAVFLSHSSKDKEFVRELCRRLKRDGVDCFFDAESIGWGDNRVRALERALDECTYIVLCCCRISAIPSGRKWNGRVALQMTRRG